jgi:hypothetical protein
VSGIVIGVVVIAAIMKFAGWEECTNLLLGLWVLVSPLGAEFRGSGDSEMRSGRPEARVVASDATRVSALIELS